MNAALTQVQTASQRGDARVRPDGDEDPAAHGGGAVPGGPTAGGADDISSGTVTRGGWYDDNNRKFVICRCLAVQGRGRADHLPL